MGGMTIGTVARETGVKVPTIRFYEQAGLLPEPARTGSNRRSYGAGEVRRLRFIRHARDLGFEIADIRALLDLSAAPQSSCHEADSIARRHLAEVEARIARLQSLRAELQRMVDENCHGRVSDCRVIEALAG